ncbi:MAG: 5-formyltetrahydrofolate cyclo-ligase [Alicyclobacillus sp.]|nr:5-formyltetrahydrofolate cyclo-ligase [Alicyclobacillus sp.]
MPSMAPGPDLFADKAALRRQFRNRRAALTAAERVSKAAAACARVAALLRWLAGQARADDAQLLPAMSGWSNRTGAPGVPVVGLYRARPAELDTRALAAALTGQGWRVAYPVAAADGSMAFYEVTPATPWRQGLFGIWEPDAAAGACLVPAAALFALVLPGLAYTRTGWRLGYGGGYYDRWLAQPAVRAWRIGVCFACQLAAELPVADTDEPVHWLVTEAEVVACAVAPSC